MTFTVPARFRPSSGPGFALLLAFPFLSPLVAGPSANAWQLLGSWLCAALLWWWSPRVLPSRGVLLWLGALAVAIVLGRGRDTAQLLGACVSIAAAAMAACVGAGVARAPESGGARALAVGLWAAGLCSAVLGLLQYYGAAAPLSPLTTAPELGQAYGNLRQRNQFATLISMALVAALWLHAGLGRRARWGWRAGLVLLTVAAAAATSRTGLLQWMAISGLAAALAWGERRGASATPPRLPSPWLLLALVPAYFLAAWALPMLAGAGVEGMLARLRDGAPEGNSRLLLWRNVLELIAEHPWRGWGWGELSYAHFSHLYAGPRFIEILDNAHNLPLHLAVELGVPAAVLLCAGFAALLLAARPWRERDPQRLLAWGVLGAIVLHSLLEYPLWYGPFQLVFGLCLGLLWPGGATRWPRVDGPRIGGALAALLIAVVGYAGWDYLRISQIYTLGAERLPPWRDDTLAKVRHSWLFAGQVRFADLSLMPVTRADAAQVNALAQRTLHFSPEPRVVAKLIESATLLGQDEQALAWAARFKIAYSEEYARWMRGEPVEKEPD